MQNATLTIVVQDRLNNFDSPSILLVKRKDVPVWVLPGGGIEPSETPEQAAIRETFEETNLKVEILCHVATYLPLNRLAASIHLFLCQQIESSTLLITKENDEVAAAKFFSINNLPFTLFPVHKSFILEWLKAKKFPITRLLTEVSYVSIIKLAFTHPILVSKYLWSIIKRMLIHHSR